MKKLFTSLLAVMLVVLALPLSVSANDVLIATATGGDLPFEITPPQNVTLAKMEDTASWGAPALGISYSVPNDMKM